MALKAFIKSGANDAAALPLIYLPMLWLQGRGVWRTWFLDIWLKKIVVSGALGAACGWSAHWLLRNSEDRGWIDKESFLSFSFTLASLVMTGMISFGGNEMLAVFLAGAVFAWDDWFSEKTRESQLQPVLDTIFNSLFFVLLGAAMPWKDFNRIGWIPLILATTGILLLKRMPFVWFFGPLQHPKERLFAGWFGPIGVGALFYGTLASFELDDRDFHRFIPVSCFMIMGSVVAHGMTVPLFQLSITRQITMEVLNVDYWVEGVTSGIGSILEITSKEVQESDPE